MPKTRPTYMTKQKAEIARENLAKFPQAREEIEKQHILSAERYVDKIDLLYDMVVAEGLPRSTCVGAEGDPEMYFCRYCGCDLGAKYEAAAWLHDPFENPWKIKCPDCGRLFPSNDFEGFYKLGLDEFGRFDRELAHKRNKELTEKGESGYLVNILYPEAEEKFGDKNWGVDDGFGYVTGRVYENGVVERHTYIAQYLHYGMWYTESMSSHRKRGVIMDALLSCANSYFYTGDIKYGRVAAILLDRIADFYPDYDISQYGDDVWNSDGGSNDGKTVGCIWETFNSRDFALCYDMVYDVYEDEFVLDFIRQKANVWKMRCKKETASDIRGNIEENLIREILRGVENCTIAGNFGFPQTSNAIAAIVLDDEVETKKWLEYLLAPGWSRNPPNLGGGIDEVLIDRIDADGQGDEASRYNAAWHKTLIDIADIIESCPTADLYNNPKFLQMFFSNIPLMSYGYSPQIGDTSYLQSNEHWMSIKVAQKGFRVFGDIRFAQILYLLNGNTEKGLRDEITRKNPEKLESDVREVIEKYGEFVPESDIMTSFGFAALREKERDVWMYFGSNGGHGHHDTLQIGMTAFGLNFMPDLGYPEKTGYQPNRLQWIRTTLSHNTATVDGNEQGVNMEIRGKVKHFDKSDNVGFIDVDASYVYPQCSEYRRQVVYIKVDEEKSYAVDFFRIKGGDSHLLSIHASSDVIYATKGLKLLPQTDDDGKYIGTYAGADVPFGPDPNSPADWVYDTVHPRGYTWCEHVEKDENPEKFAEVDFKISDFRNAFNAGENLHLCATMLDRAVDGKREVAIVDAYPPRTGRNNDIERLKYVFRKVEGKNLENVFVTVLEPYKNERYIAEIKELESDGDARALKITHKNGRVDYIICSTDGEIHTVTDGERTITSSAAVKVLSFSGKEKAFEYSHGEKNVKGKICGFTKDFSEKNEILIESDINPEELRGCIITVDNGAETRGGAYKILGAEKRGENIALDIGRVTLIRRFKNAMKPQDGYIYNIEEGQSFKIALTSER